MRSLHGLPNPYFFLIAALTASISAVDSPSWALAVWAAIPALLTAAAIHGAVHARRQASAAVGLVQSEKV